MLVLFCLLFATTWSFLHLYNTLFQGLDGLGPYSQAALAPILPFFFLPPIYGWLADVYWGNFKVFKAGLVLIFLATILACACVLILMNVNKSSTVSRVVSGGVSPVVHILAFSGQTTCFVTAIQLGLDQMPDASSANIASFVNWFVFSGFFGAWLSDSINFLQACNNILGNYWSMQLFSFLPVVCSCICCCTFLLAPKWLIIEPKCPQSLKTVYQVLKFAAKHKSPLNRSALTYWEEDIPSRLDLGKSRYGGPFTTEQVEDVKTLFKIIILLLPVTIIAVTLSPRYSLELLVFVTIPGLSARTSELIYTFTYSPLWCSVLTTLINELIVYPLLQHRYPSILKSIGISSFLTLISNIVFLMLSVFDLLYSLGLSFWLQNVYNVIAGISLQFIGVKLCVRSHPTTCEVCWLGMCFLCSFLQLELEQLCTDSQHIVKDTTVWLFRTLLWLL